MKSYKGGFRELEVWKEARIFRLEVSSDWKTFPVEEKYLLTSQIKDSSRSVTANIAEGYGRFNYQETMQFFRQSRASLNETIDHLITAFDDGYISADILSKREAQYEKVLKLINGYINFLQREKLSQNPKPKNP